MTDRKETNAVILARIDENLQAVVTMAREHRTTLYGTPEDSSKGLCSKVERLEMKQEEKEKVDKKPSMAEKLLIPVVVSVMSVVLTWYLITFVPNVLVHLGTATAIP